MSQAYTPNPGVAFSLIVPTVDRAAELERLLTSLQGQTLRDFEVLIVDQNADDRVAAVVERCGGGLSVVHLRCQRGTSRARNLGIRRATGTVLAFPDDDCWYPPDVLQEVWAELSAHPQWDGLAIRARNDRGKLTGNNLDHVRGRVTHLNSLRRGNANCLFLRRQVLTRVEGFDETLGPAARWPASEDIDLLYRVAHAGFHIRFLSDLYVGHDEMIRGFGVEARNKVHRYSTGFGRVLRKNRFPIVFLALMIAAELREIGRATLTGRRDYFLFHWASLAGLCRGWLGV